MAAQDRTSVSELRGQGVWGFEPWSDLFLRLLGGSWVVISRVISPLIWVISIVILLITLVLTTHEPPSFSRCPRRPESIPKTPGRKDGISQVRVKIRPSSNQLSEPFKREGRSSLP